MSSGVLGPCIPSRAAAFVEVMYPLMFRVSIWPLKHPVCPTRIVLKGQFLLNVFWR